MRYVCQATAVAVLSFVVASEAHGQDVPGLSIGNYQFVSEQRWSRTESYVTYRAELMNTGLARQAVTATVSSLSSYVQLVPGQSNLHFSPVPAGASVMSSNTFTVFIDRSVPFDLKSLRWSFLAPWANAGANQTVGIGNTVTLNASNSSNPSGAGTLAYQWAFLSRPFGTAARLVGADSVIATFTVDVPGEYKLLLTVSNGFGSDTATVTVSTVNSPPVANAGPNQTVGLGATVYLNGAASSDVDGNPLTYKWLLISMPTGSTALLSGANTVGPSFVADRAGTYIARLVVNDGQADSAAATVRVTTQNTPPVANAGSNQAVMVGAVVQLDGSGSTDVDGDPLTHHWSLNSVPAGSTATLSNPLAVKPSFTADKAGTYVIQLIVNDGHTASVSSSVTVTTNTVQPPVASAGQNQTVKHGSLVMLTGTGTDPQALALTFHWSMTTRPSGSAAVLSSLTLPRPTFTADVPGQYVLQLIVNNGYVNSPPSTVTITTTNTAPVASAGTAQIVQVGATVNLDGSASSDADGDTLKFSWSLTTRPGGSTALLTGATTATPSFLADIAGTYVVQLIVNDKFADSAPATVTITAGVKAITLSPSPLNLPRSSTGTLTVTLGSTAGPGGVEVRLASNNTGVLSLPASVIVSQGQTSANVTVTAGAVGTALILATATGFSPGSVTAQVTVPTIRLAFDAGTIGITGSTTATITLSDSVPQGGLMVSLSANPGGIVTIPSSITIPSGTTGSFTVTGAALGNTTVSASIPGYNSGSATVSVTSLGAIKLATDVTVGPSQSVPIAVTLVTPAPVGGTTITLTSTATPIVTVTQSIYVPEGSTSPSQPAMLTGHSFGTASIIAAAPGFQSDTQAVRVTATLRFSPTSLTIGAGGSANLNLILSAPAPAGLTVSLSSDNPSVASVPISLPFPQGASSLTVPVTGVASGSTTIHARSLPHLADTAASVTIAVLGSINLPANATVAIGQSVAFAVSLSAPAPAGGTTVTLTSSDTGKLTISPSSVSIEAGKTTPVAQPQILGKAAGTVGITATAPAYGSTTASVTVTGGLSFSPDPVTVQAGGTQSVTINLPAATAVPLTVTLTSDNTSVVTVPSSIIIPASAVGATATINGVAPGSTKIRATSPGLTAAEATVNVQAAKSINAPSNASVALGGTAQFAISLSQAPATAVTIALSSSDSSKVTISPASVTIAAGQTAPQSQPQVTGVSVGSANITASAAGYTSAIQPVKVTATVAFAPTSVTIAGLNKQNVTLKLSALTPAPLILALGSDTPSVATVPASVTVPANSDTATFQVTAVSLGSTVIHASFSPYVPDAAANVTVASAGSLQLPAQTSVALTKSTPLAVSLPAPAPSAVVIALSSSNNALVTVSPSSVTIAAGATTPTDQPQVTGLRIGTATITATAPGYSSSTAPVQVTASLSFSPQDISVSKGSSRTVTLNLSAVTPAAVSVSLSSDNAGTATVPGSATIPANASSTTVSVTGVNAGSTIIRATGPTGVTAATANVSVGSDIVLPSEVLVTPGEQTTIPISLTKAATDVVYIQLSISDTSKATLQQSTVTIQAGQTQPAYMPRVNGIELGTATLTASGNNLSPATTTVKVGAALSFSDTSITLAPSTTHTLGINLSAGAPAGGLAVSLSSSNPAVATLPGTITIPAGQRGVLVQLRAVAAGSTTLTAVTNVPTVSAGTASVTVAAPGLLVLPASFAVGMGESLTYPIALSSPAGVNGVTVTLNASAPIVSFVPLTCTGGTPCPPVPSTATHTSVFVPAGQTTPGVQPQIRGVSPGSVTITATAPGYSQSVKPVLVTASFAFSAQELTINPGSTGLLYLVLSGAAPPPPTGLTVTLASSSPGVATVNTSVTAFWDGSTPTTLNVPVTAIAAGTTVIRASSPNMVDATATVTVAGPVSITTTSLPAGIVNQTYNATLSAGGGKTPHTWSATGLPAGLNLNAATGAISGTPSAAGTSTVVVTVTDSTTPTHQTATRNLSLTIAAALSITTSSLTNGTVGSPYTITLAASNGVQPYAWSATGLPAGLTLNSATGTINGTPTAAGTSSVAVTVTDSTNPVHQTATRNLTLTVGAGLSVATASLPAGGVNAAYSAQLSATGGTTPYTWSASGLPAGLVLNTSTGAISGTPTAAGTSTVAVTVTDSTNPTHLTATKSLSLTVGSALTITTTAVPNGTVNAAYTATLAATGGTTPYTWSATGLPAGLVMNGSTGAISGTPTTAGTSTVTFNVTDSTQPAHLTAAKTLSLTIASPLSITTTSLPNGAVNTSYTATLGASGGTTPYTWAATGLPAGLSLNTSTGVISGTPSAAATNTVAVTVTDSANPTHRTATANLSIKIVGVLSITTASLPGGAVGASYSAPVAATGGTLPYVWAATGMPAGLTINTATGSIGGTPTAPGTSTVAITVTDATNPTHLTATANLSLTIAPALSITTASLNNGVAMVAYGAALAATGGTPPYTWAASGLPAGLTLNTATGAISGTPAGSSTTTVAVTVTDSASPTHRTATRNLSLTIAPVLAITTASLPHGVVGAAFTASLVASGGNAPRTWAATGLPAGLTLNATTGAISGTPTTAGSSTVAVTVTDSTTPTHVSVGKSLTLIVDPSLSIVTASLAAAVANTPYSATLVAAGGTAPYTWAATGLPAGLTLNASTGAISGTPTAAGTSTLAVTVTDSTSPTHRSATKNLSLTIAPAVAITTASLPRGTANTAYGATLVASGGQAPYTWAATGLPAGLSLNASTGAIGGTPTAPGTSTVAVTVTDSSSPAHATATRNLSLTISSALSITTASPLAAGHVNAAYSATVAATGGNAPYSWSATGLPAGLTINASTGAISGTPTAAGTSTVVVTVADSTAPTHATATKNLTLVIGQPVPASVLATAGSGQTTVALTQFPSQLQATVRDASNAPVAGVLVIFVAPTSGPSLTFATGGTTVGINTNGAGIATSPIMTANNLNGAYTVTGTVTGLPPAAFSMTNAPPQGGGPVTLNNVFVGQNLQTTITATLPAAAGSGGVALTVSSGDPTRVALGSNAKDSVQVTIPEGQTQAAVYLQSIGGTGSVNLTASAPGYSNGTGTATVTPSGFVLAGPNDVGATFSTFVGVLTNMTVYSARLDSTGRYTEKQALRTSYGSSVSVTLTSTSAGLVSPASVTFNPGDLSALTTFKGLSTGSATISASTIAGFSTPSDSTNTTVATILPSGFIMPQGLTVGRNLQVLTSIGLNGAAPSGGLPLTLTSDDPTRLKFSTSATTPGLGTITIILPPNAHGTPDFYVQGFASSGTVGFTAQAPGFGISTATVSLTPSGIVFTNAFGGVPNPILAAAGGGTAEVRMYSARLNASGAWVETQDLAGGLSATVSVTNTGSASVGSVSPAQVTIQGGNDFAVTQFVANAAGNTTLALSVPATPAGFSTPASQYRILGASVTVSRIVLTADQMDVGKDLQVEGAISLNQAAPGGGLVVTLTSNSSQLRLAPGPSVAGQNSIQITVPGGSTTATYYVQALGSSGTATYTATATGYANGNATIYMTPSGVVVSDTNSLPFLTIPAGSTTATALVNMAQLDPITNAYASTQRLRGGLSLNIIVSTGNAGIATVDSPVTINGGANPPSITTTVRKTGTGTTPLSVTQPAGYVAATNNVFVFKPMPSIQLTVN